YHTLIPKWRSSHLMSLVRMGVPLGLTMMLISLNANIPRYFVEHYLGQAPLGIFAAIAYTVTAGMTVVTALGQAASPRLAMQYANGMHTQFWTVSRQMVLLAIALGSIQILLAVCVGRQLLAFVYGPPYADANVTLVWAMTAALFWYIASILG